ncbi:hypothetical protein MSG28_002722 [Choristoneura fumiferana]|uniref:Uncharacterized protein n=1 Tax=Choristoneura fumiferana TaxID=7141 RepID=A0ACC0JJ26_CHOFU|nr:hypothetical protein MSG28_002722 [Choristoneura fumiferana]
MKRATPGPHYWISLTRAPVFVRETGAADRPFDPRGKKSQRKPTCEFTSQKEIDKNCLLSSAACGLVPHQVVGPCAMSARIATTILLANSAVKQQCLHCCVSAGRVRQPVNYWHLRQKRKQNRIKTSAHFSIDKQCGTFCGRGIGGTSAAAISQQEDVCGWPRGRNSKSGGTWIYAGPDCSVGGGQHLITAAEISSRADAYCCVFQTASAVRVSHSHLAAKLVFLHF